MLTYSQEITKQDLFVLETFAHLGNSNRFYVEIGAHDGIRHSNTKLLNDDYGWRGILVEPNPELFNKLTVNRRHHDQPLGNWMVREAISDNQGEEFFYLGDAYGGLQRFMPDDWKLEHRRRKTPLNRVRCRTLGDLLDEYRAPKLVDYLSLDTEGSELAILQAFLTRRELYRWPYEFGVITIEFRYDKHLLDLFVELLEPSYQLVKTEAFDAFFVNRNLHQFLRG